MSDSNQSEVVAPVEESPVLVDAPVAAAAASAEPVESAAAEATPPSSSSVEDANSAPAAEAAAADVPAAAATVEPVVEAPVEVATAAAAAEPAEQVVEAAVVAEPVVAAAAAAADPTPAVVEPEITPAAAAAPEVAPEAAAAPAVVEPVAEPVATPAPVAAAEPIPAAAATPAPAAAAAAEPAPAAGAATRMVALKPSSHSRTPTASSSEPASSDPRTFAKVQTKAPVVASEAWVTTQQKTFTKWTNNHLRKNGFPSIDNAEVDFESGIKLMQIVNALYQIPIPKHNANPKMRPHKLDNIALALKMVEEAKIKTNFLKSTHLIDHDLKMILGMMWAIILDYAIKGISEDDTTAKEGLLLWCRKKTAGYREIDPPSIQNFTTHWKNGMAFCALIHKHQPHLIDYDSLDKADATKNLELAFSVAESLGIPRLLDVEDMLVDKPDERSVMTQVSEFFHRFAQQDVKEVAARRAANFLGFTKKMVASKQDYESSAKALIEWVQSIIDRFTNEQFGETLEESIAVTERLKSFIINEKPAKTAEKLDLESKFAEIQQTLLVNNRPAYDCPKEYSPETLDAAFDSLWDSEKKHATAARVQRFKFISKKEEKLGEDKIKEMKDSYAAFDKDGDGAMDKVELKAALSAMGISLKNDEALTALMAKVSGGVGTISEAQWIAYNTELLTDKDTPEQIIAAFRTLADDRDTITADGLRIPPLSAEDIDFMTKAVPEAQMNFAAYVTASFAKQQD